MILMLLMMPLLIVVMLPTSTFAAPGFASAHPLLVLGDHICVAAQLCQDLPITWSPHKLPFSTSPCSLVLLPCFSINLAITELVICCCHCLYHSLGLVLLPLHLLAEAHRASIEAAWQSGLHSNS